MKKVLLTLVTVALVLASVMAFTACKVEEVKKVETADWGEAAPKAEIVGTDIAPINKDMTGKEMMVTAYANYAKAKYASALQVGEVNTTVLGGLTVIQAVEGLRIRENGNTFMYNNSYKAGGNLPTNIKVMENYYVDSTGKVNLLTAGSGDNIEIVEKVLTAKKWDAEKSKPFDTKEAYLASNPNDPTLLSMYTISNDTILEATAPEYNAEGKYYTFHVKCNAVEAFKTYVPVMKYMLDQSVKGAEIKEKGMVLEFDVQVWENGLFKKYNVLEGYGIKVAGIVNGKITLNSEVKFNYDNTIEPISKYYTDDFVSRKTMVVPEIGAPTK